MPFKHDDDSSASNRYEADAVHFHGFPQGDGFVIGFCDDVTGEIYSVHVRRFTGVSESAFKNALRYIQRQKEPENASDDPAAPPSSAAPDSPF